MRRARSQGGKSRTAPVDAQSSPQDQAAALARIRTKVEQGKLDPKRARVIVAATRQQHLIEKRAHQGQIAQLQRPQTEQEIIEKFSNELTAYDRAKELQAAGDMRPLEEIETELGGRLQKVCDPATLKLIRKRDEYFQQFGKQSPEQPPPLTGITVRLEETPTVRQKSKGELLREETLKIMGNIRQLPIPPQQPSPDVGGVAL